MEAQYQDRSTWPLQLSMYLDPLLLYIDASGDFTNEEYTNECITLLSQTIQVKKTHISPITSTETTKVLASPDTKALLTASINNDLEAIKTCLNYGIDIESKTSVR
jgi:hypothetical protein